MLYPHLAVMFSVCVKHYFFRITFARILLILHTATKHMYSQSACRKIPGFVCLAATNMLGLVFVMSTTSAEILHRGTSCFWYISYCSQEVPIDDKRSTERLDKSSRNSFPAKDILRVSTSSDDHICGVCICTNYRKRRNLYTRLIGLYSQLAIALFFHAYPQLYVYSSIVCFSCYIVMYCSHELPSGTHANANPKNGVVSPQHAFAAANILHVANCRDVPVFSSRDCRNRCQRRNLFA